MVVKDNPHEVLLYPYADGQAALVSLTSPKASGITPVPMDDKAIKVLFTQDSADGVVLRYRLFAAGNPLLRLGGKNTVMWAHSLSAWPAIHSSSDAVEVDWSLGLLDKSDPLPKQVAARAVLAYAGRQARGHQRLPIHRGGL
jgi:hypothetical protein